MIIIFISRFYPFMLIFGILAGLFSCGKEVEPVSIYGWHVDTLDGAVYKTIDIGDQVWLAENINRGEMISGDQEQSDNGQIQKYCYDDDPENCEIYGGLYQWGEALQYDFSEGARGVCPTGFRLPTDSDWKELEKHLGMSAEMTSQTLWRGVDQGTIISAGGSANFEALLAGNRFLTGSYNKMGEKAFFWTSTGHADGHSWGRGVDLHEEGIYRAYYDHSYGFSVRCVKE